MWGSWAGLKGCLRALGMAGPGTGGRISRSLSLVAPSLSLSCFDQSLLPFWNPVCLPLSLSQFWSPLFCLAGEGYGVLKGSAKPKNSRSQNHRLEGVSRYRFWGVPLQVFAQNRSPNHKSQGVNLLLTQTKPKNLRFALLLTLGWGVWGAVGAVCEGSWSSS